MGFLADKKREHESAAEAALAEKDYATAFLHVARAADCGLRLAERAEGKIATRYADDALELVAIAEQLKAKAQRQDKEGTRRAVKEAGAPGEEAPPSTWELKEKPTEKLDDVAGLADVKEVLREKVVLPFQHPEVYQRFKAKVGAGVLMYGPPGNGKTFIARAIAGEMDAAFFPVDTSQIKDKYVGETEKNLKRLFDEARSHERAVIFLDEVDNLLSKRGNRKIGAVAQFLSLTDGLIQNKNCMLVLAATNKPWSLDEAVLRPGRLGTHVYVGPPDAKARESVFAYHLRQTPTAAEVSPAQLASRTEGYSGADVAEVCDRAKMGAIRRQLETSSDQAIGTADFDMALEKVKPSVTPDQVREFEAWRDARTAPPGEGAASGD